MLTDYDRAWLAAHKQSLMSWTPLILAELRGDSPEAIRAIAGEVLIHHNHMFVRAIQVVDAVIREVNHSQIFEVYNYKCACACQRYKEKLSTTDARAFWYASGYSGEDLEQLSAWANTAVEDARRELYDEEI